MATDPLDRIADWIIRYADKFRDSGIKRVSIGIHENMESLAEIELFEKATARTSVPVMTFQNIESSDMRDDSPDMDSFDGDLDLYHTG